LFIDAVISLGYTPSTGDIMNDIWNNVEGCGRGVIRGTIPKFACRD